jgi:ABC-type transport system substrate-binding protein
MNFSFRHSFALAAVACAGFAMAPAAQAKTFKWANSGDVSSMDPYARQETFLLTFNSNIYDPLIRRDKNLKLEPALATKWGQSDPTTWFFDIRPGVKFHDGSTLTADDVVFSLNRANGPGSNMQSNFVSVKEIKKDGDMRVVVTTKYPDPLLADKWAALGMMSKAWAEKNNAVNSADMTKNEENFATRTAALIIPAVGNNYLRHEKLQRFILANDSVTVAVEVPIWLTRPDIAALERHHGIRLLPEGRDLEKSVVADRRRAGRSDHHRPYRLSASAEWSRAYPRLQA